MIEVLVRHEEGDEVRLGEFSLVDLMEIKAMLLSRPVLFAGEGEQLEMGATSISEQWVETTSGRLALELILHA